MPDGNFPYTKHLILMNVLTKFFICFLGSLVISALAKSSTLDSLTQRLRLFGERIPQEKVYVHLDNTSYFLGDTIWFAAYSRRTNDDHPSKISRVLYAELWNHDGYLVERKLIEMKEGRGNGFFALPDTLYSGYFELRAYTRWQLNWGRTEHPHTWSSELWFYSKMMTEEYYRDYDKLYSRVFPVYDKPKQLGEYYHDMTLRPLRRYFKDAPKPSELMLSLFPEGGSLVAGVPCRVAFEAATNEGEYLEGTLSVAGQEAATMNRGRGSFILTPEAGKKYTATFTTKDGRTTKADLPRAETDGIALQLNREGDNYIILVRAIGKPSQQPLGLTVMHEGVLKHFEEIRANSAEPSLVCNLSSHLSAGVNQLTIFDSSGRIYADRLFFVTDSTITSPTLEICGLRDKYQPFEQIRLEVKRTIPDSAAASPSTVSLAVRDAAHQDCTFDSGNILTEMLLASEIKGFVPQPEYFFEKDDEEHRHALDLLMLTQGWRRFNWQEMAVAGYFELSEPAEQTQILRGQVMPYHSLMKEDELLMEYYMLHFGMMGMEDDMIEDMITATFGYFDKTLLARSKELEADKGDIDSRIDRSYNEQLDNLKNYNRTRSHHQRMVSDATNHVERGFETLKKDVRVHAEYVQPGANGLEGEATTTKGNFQLQVPDFKGQCIFYLGASDTTSWKKGEKHQWIDMDEENQPEYYVRLSWPYPRFCKPYTYYQKRLREIEDDDLFQITDFVEDGIRWMKTVSVRARHGGLRAFDASKPAYVIDAYEAFNHVADAGLNQSWYVGQSTFIPQIARNYIGDMGMYRGYELEGRCDGKNASALLAYNDRHAYNFLYNLDKIYIYTDYSPRNEGDKRFEQANQPTVTIDLRRLPNEGRRVTYRDRRYVLNGFAYQEDFYHPDYQRNPPAEGQKDYRRTLYWNPNLQLDSEGKAHVTLFNNSQTTTISVEAEGQTKDGSLLYTR